MSYVEPDGHFWRIIYPAIPGEGMDLERGPYLTRLGARFSRWLWEKLDA